VIRLLLLKLRHRWLMSAIANCRQTIANADESERVFMAELRRVQADLAMARTERRWRVAR